MLTKVSERKSKNIGSKHLRIYIKKIDSDEHAKSTSEG